MRRVSHEKLRRPARLLRSINPTPPHWKEWHALYRVIAEFMQVSFPGGSALLVVKVRGGPDAYCSVQELQTAGQKGLIAHRGMFNVRGLDLQDAFSPDSMLGMDALTLDFVRKQDLTPKERRHLMKYCVKCKGDYPRPVLTSLKAASEPWTLEVDEVVWLTEVLRGIVVASQLELHQPGVLDVDKHQSVLCLKRRRNTWHTSRVTPDFAITRLLLSRALFGCNQKDVTPK